MPGNKLHIVSYDVPYPPDYGGAIDLFYKVKSLHEAGSEIYLHCYEYGRGRAPEMAKYCKELYFYPRNTGIKGLSLSVPYIINSRRNEDLLRRLQETDAPILFEGVHTSYFLSHPSLKSRLKAIRTHNIEHEYYVQLAAKEPAFLIKTYYKFEAVLLKKYEESLHNANVLMPISMADGEYLHKLYPGIKNVFIPPFHPYDAVSSPLGTGKYCLYHGNLSHLENREAAFFLINEVIAGSGAQFMIAGKNPGADLVSACENLPNCSIVANPDHEQMDKLISEAHIHVLPTFQKSGMKLKLLSALYGGRHVLVNEAMLFGTGLESACTIATGADEFVGNIKKLMQQPFSIADKQERTAYLKPYDKAGNARRVMDIMGVIA